MEDFSLDLNEQKKENKQELNMLVSPICRRGEEKVAYVTFDEGEKHAEGEIPKCVITSSDGFSKEEIMGLEDYMEKNLEMIKSMAASVNPIQAMMRNAASNSLTKNT